MGNLKALWRRFEGPYYMHMGLRMPSPNSSPFCLVRIWRAHLNFQRHRWQVLNNHRYWMWSNVMDLLEMHAGTSNFDKIVCSLCFPWIFITHEHSWCCPVVAWDQDNLRTPWRLFVITILFELSYQLIFSHVIKWHIGPQTHQRIKHIL